MKEVWEMFRVVLDERKKREIDPTIVLLRECIAESEKAKDAYSQARLSEMREFFETTSGWYGQISKLPTAGVQKFMKMGDRLRKILGLGGKE
jgi:DNA-binding transcriptional regulator GbsR (MarR family)